MRNNTNAINVYDPERGILQLPTIGFISRGSGEIKIFPLFFIAHQATASSPEKELANTISLNRDHTACFTGERAFLMNAFQRLDSLSRLPPNWDSYNAEKPNINAIKQTKLFLQNYIEIFNFPSNFILKDPNITANSEGDVVMEWWCNDKKLSFYISPEQVAYIKVAGERLEDMEDGVILPTQDNNKLINLFFWLVK